MKNKKIAITGGAGFIGSTLARVLAKDNQIIVLDDLSAGHLENIQDLIDSQSVNFVKGSITNLALLQKTFKDVDYVFHEAAIASVPRSMKDPITTNNVNISGTLNVLVAARDNNVKKVVFASSSAIYGNPSTFPIKENMPPDPLSPYAVSKLVGEHYCQVFSKSFDLPTASLRYLNVYGPRQDPTGNYAAAIPRFISRILDNNPPIIYGDGTQTRDFVFVSDVVKANILAAESNATGVYSIASGKKISINDLAETIINIIGKKLKPIYEKPRLGDIKDSWADISKAKKELHFEPKYQLTEGLKETVEWFSK